MLPISKTDKVHLALEKMGYKHVPFRGTKFSAYRREGDAQIFFVSKRATVRKGLNLIDSVPVASVTVEGWIAA